MRRNKMNPRLYNFPPRKFNWEAASVIVAMMAFIGQIIYGIYSEHSKSQDDKQKLRTMFAYEITENAKQECFIYNTRHITSRSQKDQSDDDDNLIDLYGIGKVRLYFISQLSSKVFETYFPDIKTLDADEISLIMKYYQTLDRLRKQGSNSNEFMKHSHNIDEIDQESYNFTSTFYEHFNISQKITQHYKKLMESFGDNLNSCKLKPER
ncbi:hypothetical protein JP88_004746 [Salmonella enterica subsp. enterica]|nr:hypothetical protein [Salmonella enterica]EDW0613272.1 hypothetical protein [Salmonella enterica subsp. enterica serovar Ball]EJT8503778.1 hypothetical protein [Salmonella enterica]